MGRVRVLSSIVSQIAAATRDSMVLSAWLFVELLAMEVRCEDWRLTSSLLCDEMDAPAYPRSERYGLPFIWLWVQQMGSS